MAYLFSTFIILTFQIFNGAIGASLTWSDEHIYGSLLSPRAYQQIAMSSSNDLYLFGGKWQTGGTTTTYTNIFKWSNNGSNWETLTHSSTALPITATAFWSYTNNAAIISNKVYFIGIADNDAGSANGNVYIFDMNTDKFISHSISSMPVQSIYGCTANYNNELIFYIAGYPIDTPSLLALNVSSNTWGDKQDPFFQYYALGCEIINNKLFSFGGFDGGIGGRDEIYKYNILTDLWKLSPVDYLSSPVDTFPTVFSVNENYVYIIGGWLSNTVLSNNIDVFDVDTETILLTSQSIPYVIAAATSYIIDRRILLFGGYTYNNSYRECRKTIIISNKLFPTDDPTAYPTTNPTTNNITLLPTSTYTASPVTAEPTTMKPTKIPTISPTIVPTTLAPTTLLPVTAKPTTQTPTTMSPTSLIPTSVSPTSLSPTTIAPISHIPTVSSPTSIPTKDRAVIEVTTTYSVDVTNDNGLEGNRGNMDNLLIYIIASSVVTAIILICCVYFVFLYSKKKKQKFNEPNVVTKSKMKQVSMVKANPNKKGNDTPVASQNLLNQNVSAIPNNVILTPQFPTIGGYPVIDRVDDEDDNDNANDDMYITNTITSGQNIHDTHTKGGFIGENNSDDEIYKKTEFEPTKGDTQGM